MEMNPYHIEVTSYQGASKWIRNVVSHSHEQIENAWNQRDKIVLVDDDGARTAVDMDETYMIRFQDDTVFKRRSREAKNGERRRS
jgi:hypothetical protein